MAKDKPARLYVRVNVIDVGNGWATLELWKEYRAGEEVLSREELTGGRLALKRGQAVEVLIGDRLD